MSEALPVTEQMPPRPVWARHVRRANGEAIGYPTEEEQRDAIRVLQDIHLNGYEGWEDDAMQIEAERVLDWAGR